MFPKTIYKPIILISIIILPFSISAKRKPAPTQFFKTANKTIIIHKMSNTDKINTEAICKTCDSINLSSTINGEINQINKNILSEFRRCEKFGLFKIVDTSLPYDLSVKISISKINIKSDTLSIPFSIITTETSSKRKIIQPFDHFVIIPNYNENTATTRLYSISRAMAEYRKTFPVSKIVNAFYPKMYR